MTIIIGALSNSPASYSSEVGECCSFLWDVILEAPITIIDMIKMMATSFAS